MRFRTGRGDGQANPTPARHWTHSSSPGFTFIEMVFTVAIIVIVTAISIPLILNAMGAFQFRGAVSSVRGVIQSTRYRAISSGYPYRLTVTATSASYAVTSDPGDPTGADNNFGTAVVASSPLSGSSIKPTVGGNLTLQFSASGSVKLVTGTGATATTSSCSAASSPPPCQLVLTYGGKVETISVTGYGNVTVTP